MRFFSILAVLTLMVVGSASSSYAGSKPSILGWSLPFWHMGHFSEMHFDQRLLNDAKSPINTQWDDDPWMPKDWIDDRGSIQAVLNGLKAGGLIEELHDHDEVPTLEVGPAFLRLSALDQRRVAKFIDFSYGFTFMDEYGMYNIVHGPTHEPLGVYTAYGLQLQ